MISIYDPENNKIIIPDDVSYVNLGYGNMRIKRISRDDLISHVSGAILNDNTSYIALVDDKKIINLLFDNLKDELGDMEIYSIKNGINDWLLGLIDSINDHVRLQFIINHREINIYPYDNSYIYTTWRSY